MPVTAGVALVGLGVAAYGAYEKDKAQKVANANVMPTYQIPQAELDNQRIAQSQAGKGLDANSQTAFQNNANNGLSTTIEAIQRNGGDANAQAGAYNNYNQGIQNMAIYDDQARMANLRQLMGQNSQTAAYNDKAWQLNNYAPWANKAQAYAAQMQGAQQMETSGFNTATSAGISLGKNLMTPDQNTQKVNMPYSQSPDQLPIIGGGANFPISGPQAGGDQLQSSGLRTFYTPEVQPQQYQPYYAYNPAN